jgi:hypothetical protein
VLRYIRRQPSALLLAVQLASLLIYPLLEDNHAGRAVFAFLGIGILGLVLLSIQASPAATWFAILLALPAAVLLAIQAVSGSDDLFPYSSALEAILYVYCAIALIRYMLADHEITTDELFAVGATFTLLAWAFAFVFVVIQAIEPGSFTAAVNPADERSWFELLFLSFTNLTSTGLSDVVPIEPFARSVVMFQQLIGLGYIAMLVSRLVGLTIHGRVLHDRADR